METNRQAITVVCSSEGATQNQALEKRRYGIDALTKVSTPQTVTLEC